MESPPKNGSPHRDFSLRPTARLPGSRRLKTLIAAGGVLAVFAGIVSGSLYVLSQSEEPFNGPTWVVKREKLIFTVVERGTLESAENADIYCRVKAGVKGGSASTTIKWIIDDGTAVTRGEKLIELDDSPLQEDRKTALTTVALANSNKIAADANYQIVLSQNQSEIATAKLNRDLAFLDYKKYDEAEYDQAEFDVRAQLDMARARASWSNRMAKKGYVSYLQAKSDENDMIKLEKAHNVLQYNKIRTYKDLKEKMIETEKQLERLLIQAKSKEEQALVDLTTKISLYDQEMAKLTDIEDQIGKCQIYAPQPGLVVYYVPESSRYRSSSQTVIAQGEPVREGQKLMQIPDLNRMQVNTNVHEAMVSRIRGEQTRSTGFTEALRIAMFVGTETLSNLAYAVSLQELRPAFQDADYMTVDTGHKAFIRIDAFPGRQLRGHVRSVAAVASQTQWMASDVKVYKTIIAIDETVDNLKPGMSAEVTISADESSADVLTIPIQSVVGNISMGAKRKCFVVPADGHPAMRDIVIGMSNTKMVEVKQGIEEGERVVLNPRPLLDAKSDLKPATPGKTLEAPGGEKKYETPEGGTPPGKSGPAGGDKAAAAQKMLERFKAAAPQDRKAMLEQIPEDKRGQVRSMLRSKGYEVAE